MQKNADTSRYRRDKQIQTDKHADIGGQTSRYRQIDVQIKTDRYRQTDADKQIQTDR